MKKDTMLNQTGLLRRGSTYYLRRKIPADLLVHYIPKKEILVSLRTKDRKDAERLLHARWVKLDEEFERRRTSSNTTCRTTITDDEIHRIVTLAMASRLGLDDESRMCGLSDEQISVMERWLEESDEYNHRGIARGDFSGWIGQIQDWLCGHDFNLALDSTDFRRFAYEFVKAQARVNKAIRERQQGIPVETPRAVPFGDPVRPVGDGETLEDLLDYWKSQSSRKPKTLHEFTTAVKRFSTLHGIAAAKQITKGQVVQFKDHLLIEKKLSSGTVKKQLGALSAILQLAVDNDKLSFNPARGVKLAKMKVARKARYPYAPEDLAAIFGSPIYGSGDRPRAGGGDAAYWFPLIALYTGARLSEIAQLRAEDMQQEAGITFLHILDEGDGRSVKTESSRRRVPVHPELVRLGFRDYAASRAGRLFSQVALDSHEQWAGNWSKWWGRYARSAAVGILDAKKTFHSFRHTFKDRCRAAGIGIEIHDALTGHAGEKNVGSTYGTDVYPLKPLATAVKKLKFRETAHLLPLPWRQ